MTKKILTIVALVVIVAGAAFVVWKHQMAKKATTEVALSESRPYCFTRLQEATPDAPYRVEEHMSLTRVRDQITGTKSGTQSGPDMTNGFTGTLKGEAEDGYLELVYSYTIEGSAQKELEVYTIAGADLVKQRYALDIAKKDGEEILIPNLTSEPTLQVYTAEPCK